jgi:hypothetical protein
MLTAKNHKAITKAVVTKYHVNKWIVLKRFILFIKDKTKIRRTLKIKRVENRKARRESLLLIFIFGKARARIVRR